MKFLSHFFKRADHRLATKTLRKYIRYYNNDRIKLKTTELGAIPSSVPI